MAKRYRGMRAPSVRNMGTISSGPFTADESPKALLVLGIFLYHTRCKVSLLILATAVCIGFDPMQYRYDALNQMSSQHQSKKHEAVVIDDLRDLTHSGVVVRREFIDI